MSRKPRILSTNDAALLHEMVKQSVTVDPNEKKSHELLLEELQNAHLRQTEEIPVDVVKIGSWVVIETDFQRRYTMQMVRPEEGDFTKGKLSVLSPMGSVIIGRSEGDRLVWTQSGGEEELVIHKVTDELNDD